MRCKKVIATGMFWAGSILTMPLVADAQHVLPAVNKEGPFADLPVQLRERVVCSIAAAVKYEIPANVVLAVAEMEDGKAGQWILNANGTYDVGPMQFNTAYLKGLAKYGIAASDVASSGCYSFVLAAWRLRRHIKHDSGDLWTRVANYHSRTYAHNEAYRKKLMAKAGKWADWLATRVATYEVTYPEVSETSVYVPRKITNSGHQ